MNARIRPLPPAIRAMCRDAGKSYTHILEERPPTERELFAAMDAELYEGPARELAFEQDREDEEARWWT